MNQTYVTSDTHFGHKNIIRYCDRPFADTNEMDELMIKRWTGRVGEKDILFHLGDFGWYRDKDRLRRVLERLVLGNRNIIPGNHDTDEDLKIMQEEFGWHVLDQIHEIRADGTKIIMCHYPMRSWHHNMRGSIQLFGHCHNTVPPYGKSFDVGVDAWDFYPISLNQVLKRAEGLAQAVPEPGFRCNKCAKFPCECLDNDNMVKER